MSPATTDIYTLSLHDALPISRDGRVLLSAVNSRLGILYVPPDGSTERDLAWLDASLVYELSDEASNQARRSEEHTSELQSLRHLVCRLLLEKKKKIRIHTNNS